MTLRSGLPWVEADVAGASLRLVVDSGAEESVLDLRAARKLGIGLQSSEMVRGVGGLTTAYRSEITSLQCAGVTLRKSFLVMDLSRAGRMSGLLGADFFHGRVVQLDFANRRLRVNPSTYGNSSGTQILAISRNHSAICVPLEVGGTRLSRVRLDTGCVTGLNWCLRGASTVSSQGNSSIGLMKGGSQKGRQDVVLGSLKLSSVQTSCHSRRFFPGEDGLLGMAILDQFRLTVDLRRNRLYLEPR